MYYGKDEWQEAWAKAIATQPCERGVSSAGAEQVAKSQPPAAEASEPGAGAAAAALTIEAPPGIEVVPQLRLLPYPPQRPPTVWRSAKLLLEVLPQNMERCLDVLGGRRTWGTARELLDAA